jgi:NAD(P)-dependent dehydrogenase (short-subunit alcohol dehydrogenase family)
VYDVFWRTFAENFAVLRKMIDPLHDAHTVLTDGGTRDYTGAGPGSPDLGPDDWVAELGAALDAVPWQRLHGLVLDVRTNSGGAEDRDVQSTCLRGVPSRSWRLPLSPLQGVGWCEKYRGVTTVRVTSFLKEHTMTQKIWFITGASRGFGREWAAAALERGDSVAATARDLSALDDLREKYGERLLPLRLDVTDRDADFAAVRQAQERFGRLDVVVNNAGYGHFGMVEELTEAEARAQLETNLFGALWVTQAALPFLREQGSGHILQVSSIGGISAFPLVGIYHASKWGLEGLSQALAQEVAPFGIKVTLIEPGGFATDWAGSSSSTSEPLPAYADFHKEVQEQRRKRVGTPGDPTASAAAVLEIVDAEEPPLRCFLGSAPLAIAKADYEQRLAVWEKWQPVAERAQG